LVVFWLLKNATGLKEVETVVSNMRLLSGNGDTVVITSVAAITVVVANRVVSGAAVTTPCKAFIMSGVAAAVLCPVFALTIVEAMCTLFQS